MENQSNLLMCTTTVTKGSFPLTVAYLAFKPSETFSCVSTQLHTSGVQSAGWSYTLTHTSHKDTEQSTIEASISLDGTTLIHWSGDDRINELQFAKRYQCLPKWCSGRVISFHKKHSTVLNLLPGPWLLIFVLESLITEIMINNHDKVRKM
jgi:hypothetical protein